MSGPAGNPSSMVLFRARSRLCALPASQIVEAMRPRPIETLADMPAFVLGLSLVRGALIPVVDVGAVLGADDSPRTTRFLTLRIGERCVALAVEAVIGVRNISAGSLQQLPPLLREATTSVIADIATLDESFLLVFRAARLLTKEMQDALDLQEA